MHNFRRLLLLTEIWMRRISYTNYGPDKEIRKKELEKMQNNTAPKFRKTKGFKEILKKNKENINQHFLLNAL